MSAIEDSRQTPYHAAHAAAARGFAVSATIHERRGVVRVSGEVDVATAPDVEQHAVALLREGAETLELDLGAVSFFDSSGLRLLIRLERLAQERPARAFELVACSPAVRRVLELTKLDGRFSAARDGD